MRTQYLILIVAAAVSYMMNVVTGVNDIGEIESATERVVIHSHLTQFEQQPSDIHQLLWDDRNQQRWRAVKDIEFSASGVSFTADTMTLTEKILEYFPEKRELSPKQVSSELIEIVRSVDKEIIGPQGKMTVSTQHRQTVNHLLRQTLRNFIRVLEAFSFKELKSHFMGLETLTISKTPGWDVSIHNFNVQQKLPAFLDHVMKVLAADQLRQNLHVFERFHRKADQHSEEPDMLSLNLVFASGTHTTDGMAYQAYMNFVERAEHLLTTGFMDSKFQEGVIPNRLSEGANWAANEKLRNHLTFNLRNLNELSDAQYPKNPFEGLQAEEIEHLKQAIKNNDYLASPKAIAQWQRLREISKEKVMSDPEPPLEVPALAYYYDKHKRTTSNIPFLNRISHSIQILREDPEKDKDVRTLLENQMHVLLDKTEGISTPENLQGRVRNMVLFVMLIESFGKILLDLEKKLSRKTPPDENRLAYYMTNYWVMLRQGNWENNRGGYEYLKIEARLNFQLGQSYGLYLGCYSHFQEMSKGVANGPDVGDTPLYLELKDLLSEGFFPPQRVSRPASRKKKPEKPEPLPNPSPVFIAPVPPSSSSIRPPGPSSIRPPGPWSIRPPGPSSIRPPGSSSIRPPASSSISPQASSSIRPPASSSISPQASSSISPPASSRISGSPSEGTHLNHMGWFPNYVHPVLQTTDSRGTIIGASTVLNPSINPFLTYDQTSTVVKPFLQPFTIQDWLHQNPIFGSNNHQEINGLTQATTSNIDSTNNQHRANFRNFLPQKNSDQVYSQNKPSGLGQTEQATVVGNSLDQHTLAGAYGVPRCMPGTDCKRKTDPPSSSDPQPMIDGEQVDDNFYSGLNKKLKTAEGKTREGESNNDHSVLLFGVNIAQKPSM